MCSVLTLHEMGELIEKTMIHLVEVYDLLLFICVSDYKTCMIQKSRLILIYLFRFVVLPMKAHVKSDGCGSDIFP